MIKVTGTSNVVIHREPGCFLRCLGMMLARAFQPLFVLETNGRPVKYLTPFHPSLRPRFPTFAQVEFEKFPRKFYCTTKLLSPPPMISLVDIYPRLSPFRDIFQKIPRVRKTLHSLKFSPGPRCYRSKRARHSSDQITSLVKSTGVVSTTLPPTSYAR